MHLDSILPLREARHESADLPPAEIRRTLDTTSERDWLELIRVVAALANAGGGRIVLDATVTESDILRRLAEFTDSTFDDVRVGAAGENAAPVEILVGAATVPLGFSKSSAGAGSLDSAGQDEVFTAGSFYFWHGDRSEPGTTADMRAFIERLLRRVRRRWLRGIRRVLRQPTIMDTATARKRTGMKRVKLERTVLQPVRIVSDPNAPALQPQDVDRLYPWRQRDLLSALNSRLGQPVLTTYDVQAVRRHHGLDERPDFVFHLPGAGRRYSPAVADWIVEQFERNANFFHEARVADQEVLKLRRKKPR